MPHTSKLIADDITTHIGDGKSNTYFIRNCNAADSIVKCGVIQQRDADTKFLYRFHPECEYDSKGSPIYSKKITKIIIDDFRKSDLIDVTEFTNSLEDLKQSLVNNFIKITFPSGTNLYINSEHGLMKGLMHFEDFYINDDIR